MMDSKYAALYIFRLKKHICVVIVQTTHKDAKITSLFGANADHS